MKRNTKSILACAITLSIGLLATLASAATLLPNGKQQFVDANGAPYAGGSVCFYIPNTTTPKTTWQDALETTPNASPCITLDSAGRAIIFGTGQYREQLFDASSNLVWDQLTQDPTALVPYYYGGVSTGSVNAQTISVTDATQPQSLVAGQLYTFIPGITNTAATTLTVTTSQSTFASTSIKKPTSGGLMALTGGELQHNTPITMLYDGVNFDIQSAQYSSSSAFLTGPTTPTSGDVAVWTASASVLADGGQLAAVSGSFKNLHVYGGCSALTSGFCSSNSNTDSIVTADTVILSNGSGGFISATPTAAICTINYGASGAGGLDTGTVAASTWYYDWVISNGTTTACLGSLSSTAPTLPCGYTYEARVGAVRTNASSDLLGTLQAGRQSKYIVGGNGVSGLPVMASGNAGSPGTPTWVAIATGAFVPPTASAIKLTYSNGGGTSCDIILAPNNSYGAFNSTANQPPIVTNINSSSSSWGPYTLELESTNIYWAGACGSTEQVVAIGWEDNL